jgi:hypothetical protein
MTRRRRRRLDPVVLAAVKRAARCPDCDSHVRVDEHAVPPRVDVAHDHTCPWLARRRRALSTGGGAAAT